MSKPPPLSAAAGTSRQSRSASKAVVKAASGFHVFRIKGYSLTKTIPGGERISSRHFTVGGRTWRVDLYPNGTDSSRDESDSISLYLVYHGQRGNRRHEALNRLGAQYKFGLLDHAGNAAYDLPAEMGVFTCSGGDDPGCGHDTFISREELEGRRASLLLKDDCLAIRCDVSVIAQLRIQSIVVGAKRRRSTRDDTRTESSSYSDDTDTGGSGYSDDTDTESSSYSDDSCFESSSYSDDSCFGTDSDGSRSSRSQNKHHRRQPTGLDDSGQERRSA